MRFRRFKYGQDVYLWTGLKDGLATGKIVQHLQLAKVKVQWCAILHGVTTEYAIKLLDADEAVLLMEYVLDPYSEMTERNKCSHLKCDPKCRACRRYKIAAAHGFPGAPRLEWTKTWTETARFVASTPNLQQWPRKDK